MSSLNLDAWSSDAMKMKETIVKNSTPKNALVAFCVMGTAYVLYKTVRLYLKKRKYRHIPGPPTKGFLGYFTGNIADIQEEIKNGKVMPDIFVKWHEKYGDVFKFQMMDRIIVITAEKNSIKEALIIKNYLKDDAMVDRIGRPMKERFLGNGLVTELDNEKWKQRRAMFNPGFHRHILMTFIDHFNQITNSLSDKLRSKADGKTIVPLMNEINKATLDAISLIAFGMHTDAINSDGSNLNSYLSKVLGIAFQNFINPFFKYSPVNLQTIKDFRAMIKYVRKMGQDKIMERLNAYKNNEHIPDDILSSILKNYKDGDLDIETMTDDFVTFFIAGQETTANTLSICFLEMGKNPEIVRKAREEIDRVLGERTEVNYQDVNELKYCTAIFKEALRLYPPAPQVFRKTPEIIKINGFEIPENTPLWISTYMNCRSEKNFKNPLEFKPEKFMKNDEATDFSSNGNYAYLPFSLGPRNCIGQNFAMIEGVIVIAKLLKNFDFKLDPTQSFKIEQNLTLRPKDGTLCFVTLRS